MPLDSFSVTVAAIERHVTAAVMVAFQT